MPGDLPVLAAAVVAVASVGHGEATLHDIARAAVRHVDATYGALGVLTPDGSKLDRFIVVGMDDADAERIGRLPTGQGILGLLVDDPTPLRLDDLGQHPAATGFPPGHPPMRSFLGVPIRVGATVFGNLYLTEKRGGGPFTEADTEVARALAAVAGLAITNARLAERSETRHRWGQAGTEMATALLSGADPDDVLRAVTSQVSALTTADMAGVLLPSVDGDKSLTIVSAVGALADDYEGVRLPLDGTYLGALYESGLPRVMQDISTMPVIGRRAAAVVELTATFGPGMIAPLGSGPDRGFLAVLRSSGREPFSSDDLDLLATFAARASIVLELARTQQRERRLQVQADRDRIARDLHDHVVQRIFATALSLDRLSRALQPDHPEAAERLSRSVDELDGTMAEIRAAIFELHQGEGPEPATVRSQLADVVRQVTEGHDLQRDVRFRGSVDDLPRALVPDLVAVVRELVTNVVRHAAASRVTVTVAVGDQVTVAVADDGTGLPEVTARSGLANLADRAERRGGALTTFAGPAGTQVCWAVPAPAG
ncbi:GAF domain-containing protein [Blastococcus sp. CT_GayMR19]|nr:GAF domain-containing protein [Blastococcus sp. CT_GayMR19]